MSTSLHTKLTAGTENCAVWAVVEAVFRWRLRRLKWRPWRLFI